MAVLRVLGGLVDGCPRGAYSGSSSTSVLEDIVAIFCLSLKERVEDREGF